MASSNLDSLRTPLEVIDGLNQEGEPKAFGYYEADDPDVLEKLFRIVV